VKHAYSEGEIIPCPGKMTVCDPWQKDEKIPFDRQ